ncbi:E3 ubiquitin-protein ligase RNF25 [Apostasia shenzhenica]|uniref:E3 ubiquitin-protein ligase RNF25 n=1 Tax=Apostasia shenzhenica TaxID=1088818 RepID=A0A2I0ATR3_9ASPA|nr:E3 ubiquitin-protein ligase RNF25 [Apostasia shenzhenica]
MTEEEVRQEVEAVQAVYGDDCRVICGWPPHLSVHFKPRTADDSYQQFVEVTLGIKASLEYPENPPYIYVTDMKGMDNGREENLITSISKMAQELSSCLMLVALCEEAADLITNMNYPEGDCPLCLYPLVAENEPGSSIPYMKLMSCCHCFHRECILRWWRWIEEQNEANESNQTTESASAFAGTRNGIAMLQLRICIVA